MPLQIEIISKNPDNGARFLPKPGIIAGRLNRQDMISLSIQPGIAFQSLLYLLPAEFVIMPGQASQGIFRYHKPLSGIGMSQSMSYLVVHIRADQKPIIDQLAQADVRLRKRDLKTLSHDLGLEGLHGKDSGQAKAGASLIAHLLQAVLHQESNALMLPLPLIQRVQWRLLQPGQIIPGKLAPVDQIAACQEYSQRQAAQEAANAPADPHIRCHLFSPGLQKLYCFVLGQRRQIAEILRSITMPPGGDKNSTAAGDGENRRQVVAGLRSIQDDQRNAACQGFLGCIQGALAGVLAVSAGEGFQG